MDLVHLARLRVGWSAQQLIGRERQELVKGLALGQLLEQARRRRKHAVGEPRRADLMVDAVELRAEQPIETLHCHQLSIAGARAVAQRSEEHTSELQSRFDLVCRLLLEQKKK